MKTQLRLTTVVAAIPLCAAYLFAQAEPSPLCVQSDKTPIPSSVLPSTPAVFLKGCDPWDLYYGSPKGIGIDMQKARYCAFAARDAKPTDQDDMAMTHIEGVSTLAMIFAGGKGTAPDLPLAIKFACEIQDWDGDGRELATMLDEQRKKGATKVDFDICDSVPGRQTNFLCIGRDESWVHADIPIALKRLEARNNSTQRAAFKRVLDARRAFMEAHAREEPNGTTGATQFAMRDLVEDDQLWSNALQNFAAGKLPKYTEADFKKADSDLNAFYRQQLQIAKHICEEMSCDDTNDYVRHMIQSERAWLAYREAWVAYGRLRWPSVPPDSWRTWLTLERLEMFNR